MDSQPNNKEVVMRSKIIMILLAVAFTTIIGCASSGGWNTIKTPTDPNSLFATGTAESQDLQLAIDKAALNARAEIGRQLELKLTSMQKSFAEEVGAVGSELNQYFSQTTKEVVTTTLMGSKIRESKHKEHKGINQAVVLVDYPIGAANSALVEQIKKNQNMYIRFQASEHFKELEAEVEKYEKFKKEQGQM